MVDKEAFREQIIGVASRIFRQYGYRNSTMQQIAEAAGKRKGTLYYYFPGKEEIFEAVVIREAQILRQALAEALRKMENPLDKLKQYVLVRFQQFRNLSNIYEAIFNEHLDDYDFIEKIRKTYDEQEIQAVTQILEKGMKQGVFNIEDPELVAVAIIRALKGLEIPLFWAKKDYHIEERFDHLMNILFYGIVKR